jgi:hypothetical protein
MITFREFLAEAFKDMGKMSDEQLNKGQRLSKDDGDNFTEVSGRDFYKILTKIKSKDALRDVPKGLHDLSVYSIKEYSEMKCYIGKNNTSGYAIKEGEELVSVFSSAGSSGNAIVADAVARGAKRLDCFATKDDSGKITGKLFELYSKHGFKIDTKMNSGKAGEPYSIQKGVSYYVNDDGEVELDNPSVVIFMKHD